MMTWFEQWRQKREARRAWDNGRAYVVAATAEMVSKQYASHWAGWANELGMSDPRKYSPYSEHLARVNHADFWAKAMHRGPTKERVVYWAPLLERACMEGNLSVVHAFAGIEGGPRAAQLIDAFRWLHPRVVTWQMEQGVDSRQHTNDLHLTMEWPSKFTGYDAKLYAFGGPVVQEWVSEMLRWPDDVLTPYDGYRLGRLMQQWLERGEVSPTARDDEGRSCVSKEGSYRPIRPWYNPSDLEPVLYADQAMDMFNAVCKRFGFEHKLMDAISGRWTPEDLQDPRVCAVIDFLYRANVKTGIAWRSFSEYSEDSSHEMHGISKLARTEPVLCSALELMAEPGEAWSIYQTAIGFFRPMDPALEAPGLQRIDSALFM